ncbi:MAG: response regulator [Ignavibacteriae bacterium]|nr:response regulator [Ignavibacteriota bacterium]
MTVLIVDDEAAYRMLVRELLISDGLDVLTAENGEEALRKLSVIQPDMIISDVYMPVMDGVRLHRSVREMPRYEKTPFLFVSGYSDEYTLGSMRDPKFDGFLRKGRPPQELREWIKYLTTPEEKRGKFLPGTAARVS